MTNIQVEHLSDVKKKVTFEVPQDRVQEVVGAQYKDLKRTAQIKGFRKGKVPLNILRSYFKGKVEEDVARQLIEETFKPGLDEQSITLVSVVSIDPETLEEGKPFKYIAEIEVPPQIEAKDYEGLKLTKYIRSATEEQIEERLQNLRQRNSRLSPIPESRGVTKGDHVVVDIKAETDGELIRDLTVTDYHLELGRDFYLPDFDAMFEGLRPDEKKQFTKIIPDNFPRKNLVGKTATFDVHLKEAKERILPELDDDFAKDLGEFETLDQLKQEIRQDIQNLLDMQSKKELEDQIIDALIEKNSFEVPESMVEHQIDNVMNRSMQSLAAQGIDPRRLPAPTDAQRDRVRPSAERAVKAALILKAISDKEKVEVSDEELQARIEERAGKMGVSPDYLKDQLEQNNMLEDVRAELREDKTYTLIQERAEITEGEPPSEQSLGKESEEE
ncbi:MAG TPA: trigger factor [Desulfomonilaceae bacterium]|nr:trigger factor [Desulfomonilaceae bacterium]